MSTEGLVTSDFQEDDEIEKSLRPLSLKEFIGQEQMISNLSIFISSARQRKDTLDHTLFFGPPGLGKTTLAQIIANEMGVNFRATSGPIITKAGDLAALLTNLEAGDVLFIDEIHRLSTSVEEMLYTAMEDFKIDVMIGEGPTARSVRIELPKFTLVGATTRLGLISNPLKDRFGIPLELEFYNKKHLQIVVERGAKILGINISNEGSIEIAARSRGTPRIALRLLKRVRDFAQVENITTIDQTISNNSLIKLGVDPYGLDNADRRYLNFIAKNYNGGPVGIETLAAGLSVQKDTLEEVIEPFLLQQGYISRTPRGRMLTTASFGILGLTPPKLEFEQCLPFGDNDN